jgi:hypothetical protein
VIGVGRGVAVGTGVIVAGPARMVYANFANQSLKNRHGLQLWVDLFKIELGYITAIAEDLAISHPDDEKTWRPIISTIEDTI